jgi:hypothetical protein
MGLMDSGSGELKNQSRWMTRSVKRGAATERGTRCSRVGAGSSSESWDWPEKVRENSKATSWLFTESDNEKRKTTNGGENRTRLLLGCFFFGWERQI